MKVFISWSGIRSKKIAICLKEEFSMMFHTIDFFVSEIDINTGELWRKRLAEELRTSNYGIICLTEEIISNPWILFEAGSLSKEDESRVIPLCFGFLPSRIPPSNPLSAFQGAIYSEEKLYEIVVSLNKEARFEVDSVVLKKLFDLIYPSFNDKIKEHIALVNNNTEKAIDITKTFDEIISGFERRDAPKILISWLYWGRNISQFVRKNQTFDFIMEDTTLKKDGSPAVKITGKHIYTVVNESTSELLHLPIRMISELGLQSTEFGWGFESLFYTIENEERKEYPLQLADAGDGAKMNLRLSFDIPPEKSIKFEYLSIGIFLPNDRYIWYSQEFCENCKISVVNNTKIADFHRFQINHRDEDSLKHKIISKGKNHKIIDIDKNIYPREGFTMYWREK
jgi:hypothetical protein